MLNTASSISLLTTRPFLWQFSFHQTGHYRALAARQQKAHWNNSLQMAGTGSFKKRGKWKPFTLPMTQTFDTRLVIWAESGEVRKAHKDWWLEKYYISKVWRAIKRKCSFYDCVAKASQELFVLDIELKHNLFSSDIPENIFDVSYCRKVNTKERRRKQDWSQTD